LVKISAILCYKDDTEIEYIGPCLAHFRPYVQECIAVVEPKKYSMGKAFFKKYDCKIFECKFQGSFGELRNKGIDQATGDWIMIIDVDEYFDHRLLFHLQTLLRDPPYEAAAFRRINWVSDHLAIYPDWHVRFFRKKYRYIGNVHELVNVLPEKIHYNYEFHIVHLKTNLRQSFQDRRYGGISNDRI